MNEANAELLEVRMCEDAYEVAQGAETILVLAEWQEFREIDLACVQALMVRRLIIDGRTVFSRAVMVSRASSTCTSVGIAPQPREVRGAGA